MDFDMHAVDAARHIGISEDALIRRAKSGMFNWRTSADGKMLFSRSNLDDQLEDPAAHGNAPCSNCGGNTDPYGGRYRSAREAAISRSSGICQICGFHPAMETHHWAKPRQYPCGDCVTERDLTAACRNCHDMATEIRSLQFYDAHTFVFGPLAAWVEGRTDGILVIDYNARASTRRLDLTMSTEWELKKKTRDLKNKKRSQPDSKRWEREFSWDTVRLEIGLDIALTLDRSSFDRATVLASSEGVTLEVWLESLVVESLGGGMSVGSRLEASIDDALGDD